MKKPSHIAAAVGYFAIFGSILIAAILFANRHQHPHVTPVDAHADLSSEGGKYGYFWLYTGIRFCAHCDGLATRIILKSTSADGAGGVATIETTEITDGMKPKKDPTRSVLWRVSRGNDTDKRAIIVILTSDGKPLLTFWADPAAKTGALLKTLVIADQRGNPDTNASFHTGKFSLMDHGKTK